MEELLKQFLNKETDSEKPYTFSQKLLIDIDNNFQLPIHYLNKDETFQIQENTANDLELAKTIYPVLFDNKTDVSNKLVDKWNKLYTNNTAFLEDSQYIIKHINQIEDNTFINTSELWDDIKSPYYCGKYGFINWSYFNFLNHSTLFLTATTLSNMLSPLMFFIMPIIFLAIPFVILKFQGVNVNMDSYLNILKHIARNHFLGKAIMNIQNASFSNIIQLCGYAMMYVMQIYNNIQSCKKYYNDIINVNTHINTIKKHIFYINDQIDKFNVLTNTCESYKPFILHMNAHREKLQEIYNKIKHIENFTPSVMKFADIGNVLKCYYNIYETPEYINSISYSIGLHEYFNHLNKLHTLHNNKTINVSKFSKENICKLNNQIYPPLLNEKAVPNTCNVNKNMIITGSNASGKTTILKATTINIILTQQFGLGFYSSCNINPYTHIHSYLNIPDTSERDSLFQAESRRCKEIIQTIGDTPDNSRHFCIFDELYSGTNPDEASKSGYAFLKYLEQFKNVNFMLTTHYTYICKKFKTSDSSINYKMHTTVNEDGSLFFHYKMKKGISKVKGAINVLKQMQYPEDIIHNIENL